MTDFPDYKKFISFIEVSNFPSSHWSITSGWEWEKYLVQVENDYLKEILKMLGFSHCLCVKLKLLIILHGSTWEFIWLMIMLGIHIYLGFIKCGRIL